VHPNPSQPRVQPAQDRSRETQSRIFEGALSAFAEKGFDGASTRDIAGRAQITQQLIGYHFGSKAQLWYAVVDRLMGELRVALGDQVESARPETARERARLMIRGFVEFSARRPQLHRLMLQESSIDGERLAWIVDRHSRVFYRQIQRLRRELDAEGVAGTVPPEEFYYLLVGAGASVYSTAAEFRLLTSRDPFAPEAVAAHVEALTALLLGPDSPPR
jgi:AcrR family transcriptional regulator